VSESRTTPGQLHFDLDACRCQVGPSFGQWLRAQPPGFDPAWPTSQWAGLLIAGYHTYLDRHGLVAPVTRSTTSTHPPGECA
jgi:hypothetical protein